MSYACCFFLGRQGKEFFLILFTMLMQLIIRTMQVVNWIATCQLLNIQTVYLVVITSQKLLNFGCGAVGRLGTPFVWLPDVHRLLIFSTSPVLCLWGRV